MPTVARTATTRCFHCSKVIRGDIVSGKGSAYWQKFHAGCYTKLETAARKQLCNCVPDDISDREFDLFERDYGHDTYCRYWEPTHKANCDCH